MDFRLLELGTFLYSSTLVHIVLSRVPDGAAGLKD